MKEVKTTTYRVKNDLERGFTLLEVLIAVSVLTIGAIGMFAVVAQNIAFSSVVSNRLVAAYLAQEGVEIVRNIRDTNFLQIRRGVGTNWRAGLDGCSGGCEADYDDTVLAPAASLRFLRKSGVLYSYDVGNDMIFKRKITITPDGLTTKMLVEVEVSWQERGASYKVLAATELYDWLFVP